MHLCKKVSDIKAVNNILKYLSSYELDHHSKAIVDLFPFFIDKKLPSVLGYLDSRLR